MALVVLGIDALDPELVDSTDQSNLTLESHKAVDTIVSSSGEPSTHELWPTIITGLTPEEHGLILDDGVAWESSLLQYGSRVADYALPQRFQTAIGAWLLNNTEQDAFRVPNTYYTEANISTVFDDRDAKAIGIPNYVTDPDSEDREHQLRRQLGDLFERDPDAKGGHTSSDPHTFYERCMEMSMIRIARTRRALRSRQYELVFGYTSGLDLIGHVAYQSPGVQESAYEELDTFVGELRSDLDGNDELLLVSDHGLQDGVHTHEAMVATTEPEIISDVESVTHIRTAIEDELDRTNHRPTASEFDGFDIDDGGQVKDQLENLGYM